MKIVILGLTITSSWGNGHATTFRSLCRALHERDHCIDFIEKDVEWYRSHRDLPRPDYCSVYLYEEWSAESRAMIAATIAGADVVVIGSYFPDAIAATRWLLDAFAVPVLFYDIDTPITLAGLRSTGHMDYLDASLIPEYSAYLSFTGGPALRELEERFGSPQAVALYCSVDASIYRPTGSRPDYTCDLSYMGTYAADRQSKLLQMLDAPARDLPAQTFLVAGPMYPEPVGWAGNVKTISHVAPHDHPAFYSSSRYTLNLTRDEMVRLGYSPSVRLFEASACGATILSDEWAGLETFLKPGEEILTPASTSEVVEILRGLSKEERLRIGGRARERILASHTSQHRALEFEEIVSSLHRRSGKKVVNDAVYKPRSHEAVEEVSGAHL